MAGVIADFPMVDNLLEIDEATTGVEAIEQSIYFFVVSIWGLPRRRHTPAYVLHASRLMGRAGTSREVTTSGSRTNSCDEILSFEVFFCPPFFERRIHRKSGSSCPTVQWGMSKINK